jgi:hypothetical protein
MLEFILCGIPILFVWIGVAQMSIGMWRYCTLQYAIKLAGTYSAVHGSSCSANGNSCSIQIKDAASIIHANAPGLDPTLTNLTFSAISPTDHVTVLSSVTCRLDSCLTNTSAWPLSSYAAPGQELSIQADYLFQSALAMFAPGNGSVQFGSFHFPGFTYQVVLF